MKTFVWATVVLAAAAGGLAPAGAVEMRYDRTLEKAAATIAASKMGEMRGGFAFAQRPLLLPPMPAAMVTQAPRTRLADAADDGLVPAVERPRTHGVY